MLVGSLYIRLERTHYIISFRRPQPTNIGRDLLKEGQRRCSDGCVVRTYWEIQRSGCGRFRRTRRRKGLAVIKGSLDETESTTGGDKKQRAH